MSICEIRLSTALLALGSARAEHKTRLSRQASCSDTRDDDALQTMLQSAAKERQYGDARVRKALRYAIRRSATLRDYAARHIDVAPNITASQHVAPEAR